MSTAATLEGITETSPAFKARMAGVFQLLEALTSTCGQVIILGRLVVVGNAAATAANILGHERLGWLGFASSLIGVVFHIAWGLLLYDLLKPGQRRVSFCSQGSSCSWDARLMLSPASFILHLCWFCKAGVP